ncbi:MAG: hypothetical protein HY582_00650 [Candidatus Omnitrophica bacterium]|nr:hypothetical protein [Candidatus Omnitrophota bacterium]
MPFFNIPMIMRLLKRKRSDDISLIWTGGVWVCTLLMTPKAILSQDIAFKLFGFSNVILFSAVSVLIFYYHWKPGRGSRNQ